MNKKNVSKGKTIKLNFNNRDYSLLIDDSRNVYTNETEDITIIEIKRYDPIKINYYLDIDENIYTHDFIETYLNKSVYILHFELGKDLKYSSGAIKEIKSTADIKRNIIIRYTCSTLSGSSGGPIINSSNFKVIGIHQGYKKEKDLNVGLLIKAPIEQFKKHYKIIPNILDEYIFGQNDLYEHQGKKEEKINYKS